ncbi:MAG: response regulator [Deltaproteobacteria bacterium]|nr:response regulator [Deltaproteobacteria bacterium]
MSVLPASAELLTTGEAARVCAVDPRTIARWVDQGLVPSHRTAGGRRRVLRADFVAFLRERGIPVLGGEPPVPRIAVVDDDPVVVRTLLRLLKRLRPNAAYETADNGFQAGAILASFRPHLVFLDLVMPGLSGVAVCKHIRATPGLARTAVVIISGHLTADMRAQLGGADRIISKPFTTEDIAAAVDEFVGDARAREPAGATAHGR